MSVSEHERQAARIKAAQRRSQELDQDRSRLHDRLLETAESVRRSHEQTAETMDKLANTGGPEHATRRREAAERSRRFAEEEARQVAELRGQDSGEQNQGTGTEDSPATDPA
jgi:hypothetical protein